MLFERISVERPGAYAHGWMADLEGVYHEARRGFGGQARIADRLLSESVSPNLHLVGWVTSLKATRRGAGALALQSLLARFHNAGVDVVGLIALPDDDAYLPRLINYYRRFGFEVVASANDYDGDYPVMLLRL